MQPYNNYTYTVISQTQHITYPHKIWTSTNKMCYLDTELTIYHCQSVTYKVITFHFWLCFEWVRLPGLKPGLCLPSAAYACCRTCSRHSVYGSFDISPQLCVIPTFPPFHASSEMQVQGHYEKSHLNDKLATLPCCILRNVFSTDLSKREQNWHSNV